MRTTSIALAAVFVLCVLASDAARAGVIPLPREMTPTNVEFAPVQAHLIIEASNADERNVASFLVEFLHTRGVTAEVSAEQHDQPVIRLSTSLRDTSLGNEGYRLMVGTGGVDITANAGAGLFYGVQTLEQLASTRADGALMFPGIRIADWPEYRWRGIHLDVSRHFFPVPVVEQYIDLAARYKLNTFHWHLTDDQGWRIEIKRYPRLALVGGCRDGTQIGGEGDWHSDHKRYCGYYTQDQIRAVVAYAQRRYVTIVPEIEGPGHSVSAISAYPWLGCDGKQYPVRQFWGVSTQIMCPTERTFAFMDGVLGEVASLFPGPYVHVGGDEVPPDAWEASPFVSALMQRDRLADYGAVQGYFTRRVEEIARKHGRKIVGWDEILDGGVSQSATVMAWQSVNRGVLAAKRGNDVVTTPDGLLYFDAAQGNEDYEPLSIGGLLTLQMVYEFDPMPPGLTPDQARHVLGAQGNVWAEYIPTSSHLFYMLLPRELALAELCWTPRAQMSWDDFRYRVDGELARLGQEGVNFRIPDVTFTLNAAGVEYPEQQPVHNEVDVALPADSVATVDLHELMSSAQVHYTTDGSLPTNSSPLYAAPLNIAVRPAQIAITAIAILPDGRVSAPSFLRISRRTLVVRSSTSRQ